MPLNIDDYINQPVTLFLKKGNMFQAKSSNSKHQYVTEYFLITHINDTNSCLTLMLLRPCSVCSDQFVLIPTDEFIIIDKRVFCGYQSLKDTCIRKCNHPSVIMKDCICVSFTLLSEHNESVLWQSNMDAHQLAFIDLNIDKDHEGHSELRIYGNDTSYESYQLIGCKSYNFWITDCSQITILKKHMETVKGVFKIKLYSEIETA